MGHQVFHPNAISVEGDSETGNINLSYKMPDGETILETTIDLPDAQRLLKQLSLALSSVVSSPEEIMY